MHLAERHTDIYVEPNHGLGRGRQQHQTLKLPRRVGH